MTKQQRLILIISILASFVAFLDGSVVNVALPAIVRDLGGGLATQQWVSDAYLLTLGSFILIAGSLSDLFGRKTILVTGLIGFALASILCAVAPTDSFLVAARALQGVAGALLVPSSLALIISAFSGASESKAIGTWTAWTGISFIIGPLVGGLLVDVASWRLIFAINVIPIALTLWLINRLPRDEPVKNHPRADIAGAVLCALGLGGPVFALIEQPHLGWGHPLIWAPLTIGLTLLAIFIWRESRIPNPMLPLGLFRDRNFSVGNIATTAIYAALGVATFLIVVFVQQVGHYSALAAGLVLLPIPIIMFILSSRFGAMAGEFGPRFFMAGGSVLAGLGFLLMLDVDQSVTYLTQILPGMLVLSTGLAMAVAPLISATLGSIEPEHAGIGSAINNAVARIASLLAIAALGLITGPQLSLEGFHRGVAATAVLLLVAGLVSAIGIKNPKAAHRYHVTLYHGSHHHHPIKQEPKQ